MARDRVCQKRSVRFADTLVLQLAYNNSIGPRSELAKAELQPLMAQIIVCLQILLESLILENAVFVFLETNHEAFQVQISYHILGLTLRIIELDHRKKYFAIELHAE